MKRLVLVLAILATFLAVPAHADPPYPARVPVDAIGINAQFANNGYPPVTLTDAQMNTMLASVAGQTIRNARIGAPWRWVEKYAPDPVTGVRDYVTFPERWDALDAIATRLASAGIRWAPALLASPDWATLIDDNGKYPPDNDADYAAFAKAFAQRYGTNGVFWTTEGSSLPYLPVLTYEIWNEPNIWGHFKVQPMCPTHTVGVNHGPKRYADLFYAAYAKIHEARSDAIVMIGGLGGFLLADVDGTTGPYYDHCTVKEFLQGMKLHKPALIADAVGIHMYRATKEEAVSKFVDIRSEMDSLGWPAALPIYLNEIGASVGPNPTATYAARDAVRGEILSYAADQLLRSKCGVRQIAPHTWWTPEYQGYPGGSPSTPENNVQNWYGIANVDGSVKPSGLDYGATAAKLQGETSGASMAVTGHCSWRATPDTDGDTYLDGVDNYPVDPTQH